MDEIIICPECGAECESEFGLEYHWSEAHLEESA